MQFWLEVNKFKVFDAALILIAKLLIYFCIFQSMYASEASILILYHKGEAVVDRYLDAATPPWIKV